jgi:predicted MFS family arabinose efflux permease
LITLSYYFYIPIAREDNFKNAIKEGFELIKRYPELIWIFLVFFAVLSGISVSFSYITYHIPTLRNQVISQILNVIFESFEYFIGAMTLITIYKLINNRLGGTNNLAG